ncbi:MAG TPA: hypothetical protein VG273_11560 [Bryobacteraceae bacterium]|nr:hypothetical protein [Bryobacteraceae bacterium]
MRTKTIALSVIHIREDRSQFLIRYRIENDRFAQVLSSVTSRSVVLVGVPWQEAPKPGSTELEFSVIAMIPLTASVDTEQTAATFEGNDLVLRLIKSSLPSGDYEAPDRSLRVDGSTHL